MKTLKARAVTRLVLIGFVNAHGQGGSSLSDMNRMLKLVDKLSFKDEETKKLDLRPENVKVGDKEIPQWKWNAKAEDGTELDTESEIELSNDEVKLLETILKAKDEKKEVEFSNFALIKDLVEQLEL